MKAGSAEGGAADLDPAEGDAVDSGAAAAKSGVAKAAIDETNSSVAVAAGRADIGARIRHFTGYTTITIGRSRCPGRKSTSARNACDR